jgi:hypothetical protein
MNARHTAENDAPADDPVWDACWSAIAYAAWPWAGANRAEVLDMLLAVRPVTGMPLAQRDRIVAEVWAFLVERGYTITAPGVEPTCPIPPEVTAS